MPEFKHDAFLWYNVGEWKDLGLAVPNHSDDFQSQNETIRYLVDVTGKNLQAIMFHVDARISAPPSINTLIRVHKLCTRARSILAGEAVAPGETNMEPIHGQPVPEDFLVYPTPYFTARNRWLKRWCGLILSSLAEAMQHQENAKAIEVSQSFAGIVGQYIHRVYRLMATELFQIPVEAAKARDFTMTDEQLKSYDPTKWFTSTEMMDTVPSLGHHPTEDDLRVLSAGIPISKIPLLPRWPSGAAIGGQGEAESTKAAASSFAAPPNA